MIITKSQKIKELEKKIIYLNSKISRMDEICLCQFRTITELQSTIINQRKEINILLKRRYKNDR